MSEQSAQARWVAGMAAALAILLTGCPTGGGPVGGGGNQTLDFTLTLSASTVLAPQDGTPAPVNAAIARPDGNTNSVTLTAAGLPAGIEAQFVQPGSGSAGTATLVASGATPAGTYTVKIQASDGGPTTSQPLTVVVGIVAAVGSTVDSESGVGGKLQQALGVVFEPDSWRNYFLPLDWDALEAMGTEVMSVHTVDYIPMQANTGRRATGISPISTRTSYLRWRWATAARSSLSSRRRPSSTSPATTGAACSSSSMTQTCRPSRSTAPIWCAITMREDSTGAANTFRRRPALTSPGGRSSTNTISTACCRPSTSSSTTRLCRP